MWEPLNLNQLLRGAKGAEPANCYIGRKNDRKKRNLFDVASRLLKIHFYFASLPPPLYQRKLRQS